VHWCRRRVRFNEVPEKVPKVPEKVWKALVQSPSGSTGFWRRFGRLASQYASERFVKNETLRLLDTTEAGYYWPLSFE
jgi:hypothetical protein